MKTFCVIYLRYIVLVNVYSILVTKVLNKSFATIKWIITYIKLHVTATPIFRIHDTM